MTSDERGDQRPHLKTEKLKAEWSRWGPCDIDEARRVSEWGERINGATGVSDIDEARLRPRAAYGPVGRVSERRERALRLVNSRIFL